MHFVVFSTSFPCHFRCWQLVSTTYMHTPVYRYTKFASCWGHRLWNKEVTNTFCVFNSWRCREATNNNCLNLIGSYYFMTGAAEHIHKICLYILRTYINFYDDCAHKCMYIKLAPMFCTLHSHLPNQRSYTIASQLNRSSKVSQVVRLWKDKPTDNCLLSTVH